MLNSLVRAPLLCLSHGAPEQHKTHINSNLGPIHTHIHHLHSYLHQNHLHTAAMSGAGGGARRAGAGLFSRAWQSLKGLISKEVHVGTDPNGNQYFRCAAASAAASATGDADVCRS